MSERTDDFGLVIAGHGSRDANGTREFEEALMLLKQRQPDRIITHGFLEFATPTIDEALRENVRMGSRKIVMVPGILFAASHGKNDMPCGVTEREARISGSRIPLRWTDGHSSAAAKTVSRANHQR